tara:strand:+ start:1841 stop:2128 length:288 start_codon:yes stop_codon:yes gene_type:complete
MSIEIVTLPSLRERKFENRVEDGMSIKSSPSDGTIMERLAGSRWATRTRMSPRLVMLMGLSWTGSWGTGGLNPMILITLSGSKTRVEDEHSPQLH